MMKIVLISLALVLLLGQPSYSGVFVPETYPSLNSTTLANCNKTTPLYFGLIMSFDGQQFDGSGSIPGVRVALDRINNDCALLPGYSLHYTLADSGCNRSTGLDALFRDTILPGPTKIAVIGSGCSPATEPTAEVSHYYNITQLSCVSSSPSLTDRTRFRKYFQLLSSEDTIALAYYAVIKEYGWSHVSLIVQDENLFTVTIDRLKTLLTLDRITYDERLFSSNEGIAALGEEPFNLDRRIHLIASYAGHARQLLCKAHAKDIRLPRHLLLTPAWYDRRWWTMDDKNFNYTCTAEEREEVLRDSLAFLHFNFLDPMNPNVTSDDGLTGSEYFNKQREFLNVAPYNFSISDYAQYCHDAAWTLAYALHETLIDIDDNETNQQLRMAYELGQNNSFGLNDFSYSSDALLNIIFGHLSNTSFNGITGHVGFSDMGIRAINELRIFKFRENGTGSIDWDEVGLVTGTPGNDSTYMLRYLEGEDLSTVWPGGVPYDGVPINQTVTVEVPVTVVFTILVTAGIVFACACLTFNFIFRKRKLIRLTSPNLNFMIGAGAIVLYVNLYFFVIPTVDQIAVSVLCNITPWLTAIGYSLCYGTIVAKMTRVYYIFNNPKPQRKMAIKDWMLALGVLFLVVIDVVILLVYTAVEGSKIYPPDGRNGLTARLVVNQETPQTVEGELGRITKYFIYVCDSEARKIFLGILYGYKALLQIIALVFSFSIRKVKVKGLDDAKYIAVSIYVSSIVLAVIIVCSFTLKDFINAFAAVFCTGFLLGTTLILGLVFIPLMVGLYNDPEGDTIFDRSNKTSTSANNNLQTQTIEGLKKRVIELEAIITSSQEGANGTYTRRNGSSTTDTLPTEPAIRTENDVARERLEEIIGSPTERERLNTIWDDQRVKTVSKDDGTTM